MGAGRHGGRRGAEGGCGGRRGVLDAAPGRRGEYGRSIIYTRRQTTLFEFFVHFLLTL